MTMTQGGQGMGTAKQGVLCAGGFERGNGTYWEVRRMKIRGTRQWLVYRTSIGVMLMGTYSSPDDAYAEYYKHVEPRSAEWPDYS